MDKEIFLAETNTSRTLRYLRKEGYDCGMVERYNQYTKQRHDLFNIIDIIAIKDNQILGVQSCGQAFSEHDKKILAEPMREKWLAAGAELTLIGWRKLKAKKGDGTYGKGYRWTPRIKSYK